MDHHVALVVFLVLEHGAAADAKEVPGRFVLVVVVAETFTGAVDFFADWTREGAVGTVLAVVEYLVHLEAVFSVVVQRTRLASPDRLRWIVCFEMIDEVASFCELFVALVALEEGRRFLWWCWKVIIFRVFRVAEFKCIVTQIHWLGFGSRFPEWLFGNLGDGDDFKSRLLFDEDMLGVLGVEFLGDVFLDLGRDVHVFVVLFDACSAILASSRVVDGFKA